MKKENNVSLKLLQQQLHWCKEQDRILKEIETTLYEMKKIAEYAATNKLDSFEADKLNDEMNRLKEKVASLERNTRGQSLCAHQTMND